LEKTLRSANPNAADVAVAEPRPPSWARWLRRGAWTVGGGGLIAVSSVLLSATGAAANQPDPPDLVRSLSVENAPASCPTTAPAGTIPARTNVKDLCERAVAKAPSAQAAAAIRYAFAHLGAPYSQSNRYSVNPPVFDCSSFVSRAYTAAKAPIIRNERESSWISNFGWTGAYMPSAYQGSNLERLNVSRGNVSSLLPGDVLIQFSGSNPAGSAGNNGHAQIYIGDGLIIQSGGNHPRSLVNVTRHSNWFNNEWYFRYIPAERFDPIYGKWSSLGGANGALGQPVTAATPNSRGGVTRIYQKGRIYYSPATGANAIYGGILHVYALLGYEKSVLGMPTSDETSRAVPGSRGNDFQGGMILWSPTTGGHAVVGAISVRYRSMGAEASALGLPISSEQDGPVRGSRTTKFQRGQIIWSGQTGAWAVAGAIGARFADPKIVNVIGLPIDNEKTGSAPGVQVQQFQRGTMYWTARNGPVEMNGDILAYYRALGAERSPLGAPKSPEGSGATAGSRLQKFDNGAIYWTAAGGPQAVYGDFATQFERAGGEKALGVPMSEISTAQGIRHQQFVKGMIADVEGEIFDVKGAIGTHYVKLGAASSALGLPLAPAVPAAEAGVTSQTFQRGQIFTGRTVGTVDVSGNLYAGYKFLGGDTSGLGVPTSSEKAGPLPGTRMNTYRNGAMIWSSAIGPRPIVGEMWKAYDSRKLANVIGLPTELPRGAGVSGVAMQNFSGGAMYWSQATGAHEVYGGILGSFRWLGDVRGLGVPTSGETAGPLPGTRMNTFTGGAIIWSPIAGVQPIYGEMWKAYDSRKLATAIGMPRSLPRGTGVPGSAMQEFTSGMMYWSQATGAHEVYGAILWMYRAVGGPASKLGLPITGEYDVSNGRASKFQGGTITYDRRTGGVRIALN
jgi:uncharacterized protein with LGFP repeats